MDVVVEDGPFGGEFGSCFPLSFPPVGEFFTIVDVFLLGQRAPAAPNNREDHDVLVVAVFLLEDNL